MSIKILSLDEILVGEDRQRKTFPEQEMQELQDSILNEHGLMTPILVRPYKDKYLLVAGERRLRAITSLNRGYNFGQELIQPNHIPAVIKFFDTEMSAMEAELHENVVRLNLSWQDRVQAIARLHALKSASDPKHSVGMTASFIDEGNGEYASHKAYRETNTALLLKDYLEDPDVQKAKSANEAKKIVARKIEEDNLMKLKELRKNMPKAEEKKPDGNSNTPDLALELGLDVGNGSNPVSPVENILPSPEKIALGEFYEGDMLKLLPTIPDGSIQVVLTDPPYGMGVSEFNDGGKAGSLKHEYSEEDFRELHDALVMALPRICTPTAHVYMFCDLDYFHELRDLMKEVLDEDWIIRRTPLIWDKGTAGKLADGIATGFRRSYETILHAYRRGRASPKVISDVLSFPDTRDKIHAAQKPVELYKALLTMSAVPGDHVFDPFAGSGTIYKAAKDLYLHPIGFEMNPKFAEVCEQARMFYDSRTQDEGIAF